MSKEKEKEIPYCCHRKMSLIWDKQKNVYKETPSSVMMYGSTITMDGKTYPNIQPFPDYIIDQYWCNKCGTIKGVAKYEK